MLRREQPQLKERMCHFPISFTPIVAATSLPTPEVKCLNAHLRLKISLHFCMTCSHLISSLKGWWKPLLSTFGKMPLNNPGFPLPHTWTLSYLESGLMSWTQIHLTSIRFSLNEQCNYRLILIGIVCSKLCWSRSPFLAGNQLTMTGRRSSRTNLIINTPVTLDMLNGWDNFVHPILQAQIFFFKPTNNRFVTWPSRLLRQAPPEICNLSSTLLFNIQGNFS